VNEEVADWEGFKDGQVNQIADGAFAYMQVGGWGFNNTAFIVSDGETLLIDTTTDIPRTRRMLEAFKNADAAADQIDHLALTHWHVDHVHGACMPDFEATNIICSEACEDWMANLPPKAWLAMIDSLQGEARTQMDRLLGDHFDFSGLEPVFPSRAFRGRTDFKFGKQRVHLVEAKPCHTASDVVVYLPDLGVVHLGDITSAGTFQGLQYPGLRNVIEILEEAVSWQAAVYVAGHGPTMDIGDVKDMLEVSHWLWGEANLRHDKGMSHREAADDLLNKLGPRAHRRNPMSLYTTMKLVYAEIEGRTWDHIRRNYPKYLIESLHNEEEFALKHPDLVRRA
jgi:cyclase